jgi:hypothetical protein
MFAVPAGQRYSALAGIGCGEAARVPISGDATLITAGVSLRAVDFIAQR